MTILNVDHLSKQYGNIKALDAVSFSVPAGSVFGILGPNGSGKTTLLGIVMNVLNASSGSFSWGMTGASPDDLRKQMGTLLETPNFYHYMNAEDNLRIAAKIKQRGEDDIDRVLQIVNLYERRKSNFNTFSLGMKQRLAIASALLGDPEVLVFDEPTNGLDPAGIAEIRELIKNLNAKGKTIIMASHILDEVEKVCTHVAIIQKGVFKKAGTVQEILSVSVNEATQHQVMDIAASDLAGLKNIIAGYPGVTSVKALQDYLELTAGQDVSGESINRFCFEQGIVLNRLNIKRKSLEDKFLEITGTKSDK